MPARGSRSSRELLTRPKTPHNFRVKLIEHDGAKLAFEGITAEIIKALGIRVS